MKIGFGSQLWLGYDNFQGFPRMLDEMSLVGLDGFEMCYPLVIEKYERRVGELRTLLAMHDLELASYYTGCSFADPARMQPEAEEVRRRCRFLAELGSQFILLDGGLKLAGEAPAQLQDRIAWIADQANELAAYANSCGITLAWHQHWGSIFEVEENLHRLMALTDPALVKFCPDVGQLALCGFDPVAIVQRYADRVGFVHYKDVTFAGRPQGELWPGGPAGLQAAGRQGARPGARLQRRGAVRDDRLLAGGLRREHGQNEGLTGKVQHHQAGHRLSQRHAIAGAQFLL